MHECINRESKCRYHQYRVRNIFQNEYFFFVILDSVVAGTYDEFIAVRKLNRIFLVLWNFSTLLEKEINKFNLT